MNWAVQWLQSLCWSVYLWLNCIVCSMLYISDDVFMLQLFIMWLMWLTPCCTTCLHPALYMSSVYWISQTCFTYPASLCSNLQMLMFCVARLWCTLKILKMCTSCHCRRFCECVQGESKKIPSRFFEYFHKTLAFLNETSHRHWMLITAECFWCTLYTQYMSLCSRGLFIILPMKLCILQHVKCMRPLGTAAVAIGH